MQRDIRRILVGVAGGLAGALAMNVYARVVDGDRRGHGVQPPQADGTDSAEEAGSAVYHAATGREPTRAAKQPLGTAAHYAFGAAGGAIYGLLAGRAPAIRAGYGSAYGGFVWAVADEGIVPALGLSRAPHQLPARTHWYSLSGHVIYGATLEAAMRFGDRG